MNVCIAERNGNAGMNGAVQAWAGVVGLVAIFLMPGCSSDAEKSPPRSNKSVLTPSGTPVGHLKPDPFLPKAEHSPVIWVVDGDTAERQSGEVMVHGFRLDFDETQPITEATLPYSLMTNNTQQIVVHRGEPPANFSHRDINQGEPCSPIFECYNEECPRVQELQNVALFPYRGSDSHPKCPFCGNRTTREYTLPQQKDMRPYIGRTP